MELPPHLHHGGSTAYHAPYRCRCEACLDWRWAYDQKRSRSYSRKERPDKIGRHPWYVCVDEDSFTYGWHHYHDGARCIRCGANKQTEEFWEARWKASKP